MPLIGSTFDSSEPFLYELLEEVHKGAIQLPDFQRPWVWDDEHIRSLVASISQSYPIGVVMLMETGGDGAKFKPRLVEGVQLERGVAPDRLILDGQQRLTSLYQAIRSGRPGGVSLTVFELVTATFAADDFRLSDDWKARRARLEDYPVLRDFDGTDFLTAVTLAASYKPALERGIAPSCKRKDILKLELTDYHSYGDLVEAGMVAAAKFLAREKVFDKWMLPYASQLVPLAAICGLLGTRFEDEVVKRKVAQWYWCGVFGELYGGANETRFGLDLQGVLAWLDGGDLPKTIKDASFSPTRLLGLQTRLSAAYKGVMAKLMQTGSRDFIAGDPIEITTYFEDAVDIHHIFPAAHCKKQGYDEGRWNSVVNKAPLMARTNRILGGHAPSRYLDAIERRRHGEDGALDAILRSHLIDPGLLRADDFDSYFRDRASSLLTLIEKAMGKELPGRDADEVTVAFGGSLVKTEPAPAPGAART